MTVTWWSVLPFAALLLVIAIAPLIDSLPAIGPVAARWERPSVQLIVALIFGVPVATWLLVSGEGHAVADSMVEYAQFICLLLTLYVISGGVYIGGSIVPTPRNNTILLAIGAAAASIVGTTGAAMLLIRPLIKMNYERSRRMHTVVFAIFIIANSGGLLTPLGDPPLFLGMLRGVPFFWTAHLLPEWALVNALLLITYFGVETRAWRLETDAVRELGRALRRRVRIVGWAHFGYLAAVIAAIVWLPSTDLASTHPAEWIPWREIVMVAALWASLATGSRSVRYDDNAFRWTPIAEVAAVFVGIFLTMTPALHYLASIADRLPMDEIALFVMTGGLSSILDNAPTYATFFEMAKTQPGDVLVAGVPEPLLVAISLGAVFGGALTYIGNGPNFMVRAIAERRGIAMPSFFGYFLLAVRDLVPVLAAMVLLVMTSGWWVWLGVALTAGLVVRAAVYIWRAPPVTSER